MCRYKPHFLLLLVALILNFTVRAATTNSVVWNTAADRVSADVHGEPLWPLLEDIAHQTGWHIFVEPDTARKVDVKFADLTSGEALRKLLGDLNYAFVPMTNEASQLYVFLTRRENATQMVTPAPARQKHVPNELLIKVKPGTDIEALARTLGAKIVGRDDKLGIYRLQFKDAAAAEAALARLKDNPDVEAVGYNYLYEPLPSPQTIENTSIAPLSSLTLDPKAASDPCHPIVGMLDTQVQPLNSDLQQFVMNPISVVGDTGPADATGVTHGTAMLQTILRGASQQSTSIGFKILPVQVFDATESASTWNVAMGIKAAVDNGATVLNMSLGGTEDSPILDDVVRQALARGVVIFAAAGNQPVSTQTYPAAISGVNAVTALGAQGKLAPYANYGNFVEMALPGASVVYQNGQAYVVQGTSPATAYATGVAAGFKGVNCDTWQQIQGMMAQRFPVPR
jgi:hypothetical protein